MSHIRSDQLKEERVLRAKTSWKLDERQSFELSNRTRAGESVEKEAHEMGNRVLCLTVL